MELNDILTLSRAGFTAQQIAALAVTKNVPTPTPTTTSTTVPTPLPAVSASPIDGAKQAKEGPGQEMMDIFKSLLQSTAVNLSAQPAQETTDDILASIINPPSVKEV